MMNAPSRLQYEDEYSKKPSVLAGMAGGSMTRVRYGAVTGKCFWAFIIVAVMPPARTLSL